MKGSQGREGIRRKEIGEGSKRLISFFFIGINIEIT
jgi:hypothetical protein